MNPKVIVELQNRYQKAIVKEATDAIDQLQQMKSDIFGFGEAFHRDHPKYWRKVKDNWHEVTFPTLDCKVTAEVYIRRTGLRNRTLIENMGK